MSAEYVPLFPLLADYWDKPLSELPEALQARVSSLMDWDFLTPVARSEFVLQLDEKYAVAYQQAAYDETGLNGDAINWRYWVHQMPVLSAAQAACLMSALEPHLFENLNGQPGSDDPTKNIQKARKIQELAEAQGKLTASPAEWVDWAKSLGIKVHTGFLLAVLELPEVTIVKAKDLPATTPAPVAVEQSAPDAVEQAASTKGKAKVGRPSTIDAKVSAVQNMIVKFERAASIQFTPQALCGSAADLLDACQRFEKSNKIKPQIFSTSQDTFNGWLKRAGYSFPTGRTPKIEKNYWTQLVVKVTV